MPKVVDHEARRQQLAQAVWSITAHRGLDAVSLRAVAAEAGVSMGTVQHYFGNKEQLIQQSGRYMIELANSMANDSRQNSAEPADPRTVIEAVVHQTLPLDEAQRVGSAVWLAFVARAAVDPELANLIRESWVGLHELIAGQLRTAQRESKVSARIDVDHEAATIVAVTDGLMSHLLVGHYTVDSAKAVVEEHLDRIFSVRAWKEHF